MKEFQKLWAPIAAVAAAVLLLVQLRQAFIGNRSLVSGLLILFALIMIGAVLWKFAFEPSVVPPFPKYRYHRAAKFGLAIDIAFILVSFAYTFNILVDTSPEILDIKTRKAGLTIYADIYFKDDEGDAYLVAYELVNSTTKDIVIRDDAIAVPANDQISGTVATVTWSCFTRGYTVTLKARIIDKADNQSDPFPVTFDCR